MCWWEPVHETGGWKELVTTFDVPHNADRVNVDLFLETAAGVVHVKGVELVRLPD